MRIGSETVDITPNIPIELAGYGYDLDRQATSVESRLTAHALILEDASGQRAVLCSADLMSVNDETVAAVTRAVSEQLGDDGPEPIIMINASHTHSGPASYNLLGAGGYNEAYVSQLLVPKLTDTIVAGFQGATEGKIGVARAMAEPGLHYNRTGGIALDQRVTCVGVETEDKQIAGAHFACHPVVYGKDSTAISSDYPGVVRAALLAQSTASEAFWLTGCAGDVDPLVNKTRKGNTTVTDVAELGLSLGSTASELHRNIRVGNGILRTLQTVVELPIDTAFELNPTYETNVYREVRELATSNDMTPYKCWLESVAPVVNANEAKTLAVPLTAIAIGRTVFVGFGAEIYTQTGQDIEAAHPDLEIVTMMNTNEHKGYIPTRSEYDNGAYAARSSAFIFGRKPLMKSSEEIFQAQVNEAIDQLAR